MTNPFKQMNLQEIQDRHKKLDDLPREVLENRRRLAFQPTLTLGRWQRHFESAWTTLLLAEPNGDPRDLVDRAKKHADEAFAITEPMRKEAEEKADRVFLNGEDP